MSVFTSAYKVLAHLQPNWDTQLRADMSTLETILAQNTWTPGATGPSFSIGSGGTVSGNVQRLGQAVKFNGSIVFGSSASFGSGVVSLSGFNAYGNMNFGLSLGYGQYNPSGGGAGVPVVLVGLTATDMACYAVSSTGTFVNLNALGTPGSGAQIRFAADVVLA